MRGAHSQAITTLLLVLLSIGTINVLWASLRRAGRISGEGVGGELPPNPYVTSRVAVTEFAAALSARSAAVELLVASFLLAREPPEVATAGASSQRPPTQQQQQQPPNTHEAATPQVTCGSAIGWPREGRVAVPAGVAMKALSAAAADMKRLSDGFVENVTFATNTADKLLYQLRNFEPMHHRFSVPQWNDIPLSRQAVDQQRCGLVGISTVNRQTNYLLSTVRSFVSRLAPEHRRCTKIIIFNGDFPPSKHLEISRVKAEFASEIALGLIEIIEATRLHPQLESGQPLAQRWGDSVDRVRWRSKQVLDVAFLMDYVHQHHGGQRYFLMMEDDIIAAHNYLGRLRQWVDTHLSRRTDWTLASFYNPWEVRDRDELPPYKFFGVIGQLFRVHDLPVVVEFLRKNFDQSPLDWLFVDFLKKFDGKIVVHTPSLFQHQGTVSSLEGKAQSGHAVDFGEFDSGS